MKIAKYLDIRLISFLKVKNRDESLVSLIEVIGETGLLEEKEIFLKALIEREKIVSTGIGMGVAIPHAKLALFDHFFIAIGILDKGVDWKAIDGAYVRLIFMIGGPDDKQTEYLQILSSLTQAIKDEELRKKMLTCNSPQGIIELLNDL
jgi:PTS system nitrogen regulatory IIA component